MISTRSFLTLALALALLGVLPAAAARTKPPAKVTKPASRPLRLRVSPGGKDTNPGTVQRPLRTIAAALQHVHSGGAVEVAAGTYVERLVVRTPQITLCAVDGQTATLRGDRGVAIELWQGVGHVTVRGLRVEGYETGVALRGANRDVTLSDLVVAGSRHGIRLSRGTRGHAEFGGVDDVTIRRCTVANCAGGGIDGGPGAVRRLTVAHCRIESNGTAGGDDADGINVDVADQVVVDGCAILGNGGDGVDIGARGSGPIEGVTVRGCAVVANGADGIRLWHGGRVENTLVARCGACAVRLVHAGAYALVSSTLVHAGRANGAGSIVAGHPQEHPAAGPIALDITKCIVALNGRPDAPSGAYLGPSVRLREAANVYYSREDEELRLAGRRPEAVSRDDVAQSRWPTMRPADVHSACRGVDPRFVDAERGDYRLREDSTVRDAGPSDEVARYGFLAFPRETVGRDRYHMFRQAGP